MKPNRGTEEWWASLSQGEKTFIRAVMLLIKGAKRSRLAEVARAARLWEPSIGCFIKVRLMNRKRK